MSTNIYHVDQNIIFVLLDEVGGPQNENVNIIDGAMEQQQFHQFQNDRQVRKINKEKLKIILQISGCKPSHSFQLCERIFDQIFSKLLEQFDKPNDHPTNNQMKYASKASINSAILSEQYFRQLVVNAVGEKKYIRHRPESYLEDFQIAWTLTERKQPLIILLGGTSGTGKSTAGSILASRFGISTVLSTDSIRHIMRNFMTKDQSPILFASTYEAGKSLPSDEQMSEARRVIKGYKKQCELVQQRLEHVIAGCEQNQDPIIIEGVHLTPFFMFKIMRKYKRVLPFAICITKESKHKERFAVRSKYMTLDSRNNKYVENFAYIRLIQKWFLEKADEYLIPKVDNVNIDKSIGTIHRTVVQYMKKLINNPEINNSELKNALPFYEEYNKVQNNAWSSEELKEYINSKVNKTEIYEKFLSQMNDATIVKEISTDEQSSSQNPNNDVELLQNSRSQKDQIQQSVQKFNEINLKNEKSSQVEVKNTEANFIVGDQNEINENANHLSDQEEQNEERRRRNQDDNSSQKMKKTKSLKSIVTATNHEEKEQDSPSPSKLEQPTKPMLRASPHRVTFQVYQDEPIDNKEHEHEQTPQKTDYKGILYHLTKHKRMFLSKKTKPSNLLFIKKMVQNYNMNYQSHDRMKLIQNNDGSYCLFKINAVKQLKKLDSKDDSSSDPDESEIHQGKTPTNFPFSEKREQSDGDSIHFQNQPDSDENEEIENENVNSVEASSSDEERDNLQAAMQKLNEDEDSFELNKINEEDEYQEDEINDNYTKKDEPMDQQI